MTYCHTWWHLDMTHDMCCYKWWDIDMAFTRFLFRSSERGTHIHVLRGPRATSSWILNGIASSFNSTALAKLGVSTYSVMCQKSRKILRSTLNHKITKMSKNVNLLWTDQPMNLFRDRVYAFSKTFGTSLYKLIHSTWLNERGSPKRDCRTTFLWH